MNRSFETNYDLILLITIDSLRADFVNSVSVKQNSLRINDIAQVGTYFSRAYSHGGGTPEAFPSIMSGCAPPFTSFNYGVKGKKTLALILKEQGYHTIGIHCNPYLSRLYGYEEGFDQYLDLEERRRFSARKFKSLVNLSNIMIRSKPPIANAEETTHNALEQIRRVNNKTFCWIHYMDTHLPYLPAKYASNWDKLSRRFFWPYFLKLGYHKKRIDSTEIPIRKFRRILVRYYSSAVHYVDHFVGILYDYVIHNYRNPLIVIMSDHGEQFWDHGIFGHAFLYDEITHVPLIIFDKTFFNKGNIDDRLIGTSAVAPTINYMTTRNETDSFGQNLLEEHSSREYEYVISSSIDEPFRAESRSVRATNWKYIEVRDTEKNTIHEELYDLDMDPLEKENSLEANSSNVLKAKQKLKGLSENRQSDSSSNPLSKEDESAIMERLKSLGYV